MAINNVNVQYNGGFLPDIILWTQCYLQLARRLHQFKASTTMDLGISIFLISVQNVWP